ncbi:MAG: hypothetical protein EGQ26_04020 [Clostridiales bacterium]|nr:hypothetical protein [Clostridiales bacterium]
MVIRKPVYYDDFRCAAGACPDSCCHEWEIQVDAAAAERYRMLSGTLGDALHEALQEENGETLMTLRNGRCPMWRPDGLCRIQAELGEQALCQVCRDFPRLCHDYGDFQEKMLELSCPEAARWILGEACLWVEEATPEVGEGDYDPADMKLLLESRERARAILAGEKTPGRKLAGLLLLGIETQQILDGEADPEAPGDAEAMSVPASVQETVPFYEKLEILTERWRKRLALAEDRPLPRQAVPMARYLVDRYWLQAVSDLDLYGRVKFMLLSVLLTASLPGSFPENAQLWSKEIENDPDNVDAILDGAYQEPAFADGKLLGMLLQFE